MTEPNDQPGSGPLSPPPMPPQPPMGGSPTQVWSTGAPPPPAPPQQFGPPPSVGAAPTQAWSTPVPPAPPVAAGQTQAWSTGAPLPPPAGAGQTQAWHTGAPVPPAPVVGSETRPWDAGATPFAPPAPPAIDQQLWAGSLDQPGPDGAGKRSTPPKKVLIGTGVLAAVAAAVGVTGYLLMPKNLDVKAAQDGVQQILTDAGNGYGIKNVSDVKCNDGKNPKIKSGATFNCDVKVDGADRKVTVTFSDNSGGYEVSRPQ